MRGDRIAAVLAETSLFSGLDDGARRALTPEFIPRTYRKGDLVFSQGDQGESLFIVAEGLVKLSLVSLEGAEMVLATIRPPSVFGELALLDGGPRTASARALQATTLLALTRPSFIRVLLDNPRLADALHRSLGAIIRRTLQQASDLVFLDLPGRVAKLLLALAGEQGQEVEGGIRLDLDVTQTTLAGMVGGSRPSVNQCLRSFQERGLLELSGREILIRDLEGLRRRADI
jgi:CRP/FNR family transcriptional regulator, cyclic AMP receptor protein